MATEHLDMWESLIGSRKSPLKQASLIGFGTLFALFTRRLTLEDAVRRVGERIGIKGRAIVWPYAEPCMDVDKPSQSSQVELGSERLLSLERLPRSLRISLAFRPCTALSSRQRWRLRAGVPVPKPEQRWRALSKSICR
jgi:hypothetical protein